ncbi:hypothetical protein Tco_1337605 [Tanacetum coccineum]
MTCHVVATLLAAGQSGGATWRWRHVAVVPPNLTSQYEVHVRGRLAAGEWEGDTWHSLAAVRGSRILGGLERISKKRTKNEAKTTKPDTEWKSMEKTKSRQSPSMKKSTQVNPDKSKVKPKATSEEK